jgi:hypothetical protein
MGPPSCMRSVVDRNVVTLRMTVLGSALASPGRTLFVFYVGKFQWRGNRWMLSEQTDICFWGTVVVFWLITSYIKVLRCASRRHTSLLACQSVAGQCWVCDHWHRCLVRNRAASDHQLRHVCPSDFLGVWNISAPSGLIVIKFGMW